MFCCEYNNVYIINFYMCLSAIEVNDGDTVIVESNSGKSSVTLNTAQNGKEAALLNVALTAFVLSAFLIIALTINKDVHKMVNLYFKIF